MEFTMLLCMYEKAKASALREHELVTEYDYIFLIKLSISFWKIDMGPGGQPYSDLQIVSKLSVSTCNIATSMYH